MNIVLISLRLSIKWFIFKNKETIDKIFDSLGNESSNRPFPSSSQPPFQSEAKCEVFVMKISFHSY